MLKLKYFGRLSSKTIDRITPAKIPLRDAILTVENLPIEEDYYVGFINDGGSIITFVRLEKERWLLRIQIREKDTDASEVQTTIKRELVSEILRVFTKKDLWTQIVNTLAKNKP